MFFPCDLQLYLKHWMSFEGILLQLKAKQSRNVKGSRAVAESKVFKISLSEYKVKNPSGRKFVHTTIYIM